MEVDDKVHVDLLDADGEGVGGVEGDGDEGAAGGVLGGNSVVRLYFDS